MEEMVQFKVMVLHICSLAIVHGHGLKGDLKVKEHPSANNTFS
jgi:hypothetical protein